VSVVIVGTMSTAAPDARATDACPVGTTPLRQGGCVAGDGSGPVRTVVLVRPDTSLGDAAGQTKVAVDRAQAALRARGLDVRVQPVWVGDPAPPTDLQVESDGETGARAPVVKVSWLEPESEGDLAVTGFQIRATDGRGKLLAEERKSRGSLAIAGEGRSANLVLPVGSAGPVSVEVSAENGYNAGGDADRSSSTACAQLGALDEAATSAPCRGRTSTTVGRPDDAVGVVTAGKSLGQVLRQASGPVAVVPVTAGTPLEDLGAHLQPYLDGGLPSEAQTALQLLASRPVAASTLATLDDDLQEWQRTTPVPAPSSTTSPSSSPSSSPTSSSPPSTGSEQADATVRAGGGSSALPLLLVTGVLIAFALAGGALLLARARRPVSLLANSGVGLAGAESSPAARVRSADRVDETATEPVRRRLDPTPRTVAFLGARPADADPVETPMHITPDQRENGRAWALHDQDLVAAAMWSTPGGGAGEDADPSLLFDWDSGLGLVAAYDGVGGAGAGIVEQAADGSPRSGAYVAARAVREATEQWFLDSLARRSDESPPDVALHRALRDRLAIESSRLGPASGRLAGSLVRQLPTTIAGAAFRVRGDDVVALSLWAGDSRCHALTPDDGLQQLTVDDTPNPDALEAIVTDSPMTNMVCADRPFTINAKRHSLRRPVVLVAATDGCFGYLATPAHFEYLLLETLTASSDPDDWADRLLATIHGVAGDDASMALVALGFSGFAELRDAFSDRRSMLEREHWDPVVGVDPADRETFTAARAHSWDAYRLDYEARLPLGGVGAGAAAEVDAS
jgi:hypothetical protein